MNNENQLNENTNTEDNVIVHNINNDKEKDWLRGIWRCN